MISDYFLTRRRNCPWLVFSFDFSAASDPNFEKRFPWFLDDSLIFVSPLLPLTGSFSFFRSPNMYILQKLIHSFFTLLPWKLNPTDNYHLIWKYTSLALFNSLLAPQHIPILTFCKTFSLVIFHHDLKLWE